MVAAQHSTVPVVCNKADFSLAPHVGGSLAASYPGAFLLMGIL
jgi:hypothetical protein